MSAKVLGPLDWGRLDDKDSYRDYEVKWLVKTTSTNDGPAVVSNATGLPAIGAQWNIGNDVDPFAFCWPNWRITSLHTEGEPHYYWAVTQTFTTRPLSRCQDQQIENPLAEPPRLSGGFHKFTRKGLVDIDGQPLTNSSWEPLRGPESEFDDNRPTVRVAMNVLTWPGVLFGNLIDHVNDDWLWGFPPRCVKLSNVSWQRLLWGVCTYYFTVEYEFDICTLNSGYYNGVWMGGFDRLVDDYGTKCLQGWSPGSTATQLDPEAIDTATGKKNKLLPSKFERYKDINGENLSVPLDGVGRPVSEGDAAFKLNIRYYPAGNMPSLGIPLTFNG